MGPVQPFFAVLALCAAPADLVRPPDAFVEPPSPPPAAEARALLRPPESSLSFGTTGRGHLEEAVSLPLRGEGWAFLPRVARRGTHWGTAGILGLLRRAGVAVREVHPDATILLGNVSLRSGGPTRWHASHQAGRDLDILPFALDRQGRPVETRAFVSFRPDGLSTRPAGRYRFDVERNLTLVRALLEDPEAQVQWIFVADWLKARLLEEARRRGLPDHLLARMEAVLHQPSDSNPHDDHLHVRLYCSVQDRLHGCLDPPPHWPWVDRGDERYATRVRALRGVARSPDPELRSRALRALGDIRARAGVPTLLARLEDPVDDVRESALEALRAIGTPAAIPGLLAALYRAEDPDWAARLFRILRVTRGERPLGIALRFLARPTAHLHPRVASGSLADFQVTAAEILGRRGRKAVVPALLPLLASPERRVRHAVAGALTRATNHVREGAEQWRSFWRERGAEPWLAWLARGFEAAGYDLPGAMEDPATIPVLIEAAGDRRSHVSQNAVRALSRVTGHAVDPFARSPRALRRHWRSWWEEHGAEYATR
ncbi:MAG: penicillin-insensitive murein endopeptidase [Myxococcota bacterium]